MSSVRKIELEFELKSPADAVWNSVKDKNFLYPKLFPEAYKSIEILEGDGRSAGTIRFVTFAEDVYNLGKTEKSMIEYVDEDKKAIAYRVLEGRALGLYKSFQELTTVRPAKGEGSVAVWTCTYEKPNESTPDPGSATKDHMLNVFHKLDAYVLASINNNN